jgi:hypothetical protein
MILLQVTAEIAGQSSIVSWVLGGVLTIIGGMSAAIVAMWSHLKEQNAKILAALVNNTSAIEKNEASNIRVVQAIETSTSKQTQLIEEFRSEFRRQHV